MAFYKMAISKKAPATTPPATPKRIRLKNRRITVPANATVFIFDGDTRRNEFEMESLRAYLDAQGLQICTKKLKELVSTTNDGEAPAASFEKVLDIIFSSDPQTQNTMLLEIAKEVHIRREKEVNESDRNLSIAQNNRDQFYKIMSGPPSNKM